MAGASPARSVPATPLLAVAVLRAIEFTPVRESCPLGFVDFPDRADALAAMPGFLLLTAAELDGPIDMAKWRPISRHDLRYWRPQTLGESLFNYWDQLQD